METSRVSKGSPAAATVEDSRAEHLSRALLSGHTALWVQVSENLVRRESSAIFTEPIWLPYGYVGRFSHLGFSSPSTFTSLGWMLIKGLLLRKHLKIERYDKEWEKNPKPHYLVFSDDKLRKPYPFSWRAHWARWTR